MSTNVVTKDDQQLGLRYYGGTNKGATLKVNLTKAEFENFKNTLVCFECQSDFVTFNQLVNDWVAEGKTLEFETSVTLNETARKLENSRWVNDSDVGSGLLAEARVYRARAKQAVKNQLKVVS